MAIINGVGRIGIRNYVATQQITTSTLLNSLYSVWNADTLGTSLDTSIVGVWNAENSTNILDTNIYSVFTDLTTYTNTGLTNSQTGLWDAEGLGLDDKVGTNHLTSYNSATFSTDAIFGTKSFTFTTATQYFGLPVNSWNFTGDFSVSFWTKATWGNNSIPISNCVWVQTTPTIKYSGWQVGFNGAKPYFYGVSGGTASFSVSSAVNCVSNSWSNVVVTKSNNVVSIYVNGLLGGTSSVTGNITYATTSYPSIGAQKYSSTGVSDHIGLSTPGSKFDNISTWTKVLSHDDVIALYNSGSGQSYPYTQPVTISVDKSQSLKGFVVGTGSSVVSGKTGNAISLTQSSAIILKDISALKFTGDFSVSFWFKTSDVTTGKAPISRHDGQRGWYVYILNGNILWASGGSVGVAFGFNPTTLVANTWYHVAVSLTNNVDVKCYLNGVLGGQQSMVSKTITYDYWNSYHPAVIGGRANNNGSSIYMDLPFNGIIDDINTWNRPITQNEVYQLYNGGDGVEYPYAGKLLSSPNDSVGTNHGTLMNGCTYTTGKIGNTFTFDGVNDLVSLPSGSLVFTGDFSVSVWVYASVLSGEKHIIANVHKEGGATGLWKGWNVFVYNNKVYFRIWNSGSASDCVQTSTFTTGQWYLITVTKKGSSQKLYINGILESTNNSALTPNYSSPNFPTIGTSWYYTGYNSVGYDYSYCWNGKIDGVTTWQKELTSDEVTQLYNAGTGTQYPFSSQTLPSANNQFAIDNGTLMNGCTFTDGKIGQAFNFDGVNDYVALPDNSLNINSNFSASAWVKYTIGSGIKTILSNNALLTSPTRQYGWGLYLNSNNILFQTYDGTSTIGGLSYAATLTSGSWYHITVTKSGTTKRIYLNGTEVANASVNNITYTATHRPTIGGQRYDATGMEYFSVSPIDGLSVWQKELTQAEVTELYNSGNGKQLTVTTPIVTNGLVLNLDASRSSSYPNTGTTWFDISGNTNNGTLTNGPIFGTASGGQITFDGINDYVDTGLQYSLTSSTNFTIGIWFKGFGRSSNNDILVLSYSGTPVGWAIYQANTGKFMCFSRDNNNVETTYISSTTSTNTNQWFYGVYKKSGNQFSLYINGVLEATTNANLGNITISSGMRIGNHTITSQPYLGSIGSVKVYNKSLTDSEILQNFNAVKSRFGL